MDYFVYPPVLEVQLFILKLHADSHRVGAITMIQIQVCLFPEPIFLLGSSFSLPRKLLDLGVPLFLFL